uniref:Uncharacterized protein n=1 Tax=Knipowitschia caucasica TaxID=637954 RepID=A0AAV2MQX4_KNICA
MIDAYALNSPTAHRHLHPLFTPCTPTPPQPMRPRVYLLTCLFAESDSTHPMHHPPPRPPSPPPSAFSTSSLFSPCKVILQVDGGHLEAADWQLAGTQTPPAGTSPEVLSLTD